MKEFPAEILISVFIQLHLKDKVECLAVCKNWACIIKTHCLLHTIRITSKSQMDRIVEKIETEPFHANIVERLIFDLDAGHNFNLIRFFNLFPNLRTIYMERSLETQFPTIEMRSENNYIERIYDIEGCALASYFITSNKCSQLKQLVVNENRFGTVTLRNFIERFPYMPALTKLSLSRVTISFNKLESLHNALPSLRSLSISDMRLKHTKLPDMIAPAASVAFVCIDLLELNTLAETKYFQYASQKYPNLLRWSYSAFGIGVRNPDQFFNNGVAPFIQSLAFQLKRCVLNVNNMPQHICDILDQINSKGRHFTMNFDEKNVSSELTKCIQLNQMKYIRDVLITYNNAFDFKILKEFITLEDLEITCLDSMEPQNSPELRLNDILDMCADTIKSLAINSAHVKFDVLDARVCSSIKSLSFYDAYLNKGLDFFISQYLPNLDRLLICTTLLSEDKFLLEDTNLSYLHIEEPIYLENMKWVGKYHMNLLVLTQNVPEGRLWVIDKFTNLLSLFRYFSNENAVYPHVKCIPQKKQRLFPTLTFKLASVKTVFIGGMSPEGYM